MAILHPITDFSVATKLIEKKNFTVQDRYILDSVVSSPLVKFCGDIRSNEIKKVQEIETENVFNFLLMTMAIFGKYNKEKFVQLLSREPLASFVEEIKSLGTEIERERVFIRAIPKLLLNGKLTSNLSVKVVGEMPQKRFSFRQMTADDWFNKFVDYALLRISHVNEKLGTEEAFGSLCAICAYFLYNSQPSKYDISSCKNPNEAISQILKNIGKEKMEHGAYVYSDGGELLSKSL